EGPVHVMREDPVNPDLLYVGTEFGLFVSLDAGASWHRQKHLPTVPVHDLVVHPRDRELVVATHGRGIYVMQAAPLQELTAHVLAEEAYLCDVKPATAFRRITKQKLGIRMFAGENTPYGAPIFYYFGRAPRETPTLVIKDRLGSTVAEAEGFTEAGLHKLNW